MKNVKVDEETHALIGEVGKIGESYGDIIKRAVQEYVARHRTAQK